MEEYTSHQDAIARVQAYMDELDLRENMQKLHKRRVKDYQRNVDRFESSDEDDNGGDLTTEDEELDLEEAMEKEDSLVASTSNVQIGVDLRKRKTSENNVQKGDSVGKKQKQTSDNSMQKTEGKDTVKLNKEDTDVSNKNTEDKAKSGDDSYDSSASEGDSDTGSSGEESEHAVSNMQKRSRVPKPQAVCVLFKNNHCLFTGCAVKKKAVKILLNAHSVKRNTLQKEPETYTKKATQIQLSRTKTE